MRKKFIIPTLLLLSSFLVNSQTEEEVDLPKYTMFSVESSHAYNGSIHKQGINSRFYIWANEDYSFGPEFTLYFPTKPAPGYDYQLDFNFRKILVNFHPVTFEVLLGPGWRNYQNTISAKREWNFDGINIGFGIGYRIKNITLFCMPKINHKDAKLQVATGFKYHFNGGKYFKLKNRYNLKKS